jgi:hypothetical protein
MFESNYNTCVGRSRENMYAAVVEALRKEERQDETQFTTQKFGGKTSLGVDYFAL